jgi:RIP metalloprotease RseP
MVTIQPKQMTENGPQSIGIILAPHYIKSEYIKSDSLVQGIILAMKYVSSVTYETAQGLFQFFTSIVFSLFPTTSTASGSSNTQLSGPIGLIRTGTEIVSTQNWNNVLLFAAAISINLGVVNALPIPALDGGQLVFVFYEAITSQKVNQKLQEGITSIAVLLLIFITANTLFSDITNIVLGR